MAKVPSGQKKERPLKDSITELEKSITETDLQHLTNIIAEFVDSGRRAFRLMSQKETETQDWLKEYHRHIIAEYAKGPQSRVYGLIFLHRTEGRRKIVLVFAETFEDALKICEESFVQDNDRFSNWTIEAHKYLSFPKESREIVPAVDRAMQTNKPVGVFINDLSFIRDRFCESDEEKALINKIAQKVVIIYENINDK
jgi:hypothetical protein